MTEPDISYANMGKAYKMGSSQEARKHCLLTAYPKRTCWVGQGERSSRLPWGCDGWAWILEGGSWRSLGKERRQENPKQKEWHEQSLLITHSSILTWRIPWTEEPGRLQSMGSQRVGHNWVTNTFTSLHLQHLLLQLFSLFLNFTGRHTLIDFYRKSLKLKYVQ